MKKILTCLTLALLLAGCDLLPFSNNDAPTVRLTRPGNNATLIQGESATILADADDSDGEVARVEFAFDGRPLSTATQVPYTSSFAPLETGQFMLTAQAFDDQDAVSDTASVSVTVAPAPTDTFNVNVTVSGAGTVTSDPDGIDCGPTCARNFSEGETVVLSAQPDAGESFEGWGGDCSGDVCRVTGDANVTATFSQSEPRPPTAGLEPFTLVSLPDTQGYVCCDGRLGSPTTFTAQTRWIVDNLNALNIDFVTHEGDIVSEADIEQEWRDADAAMSLLDGRVPYSAAMGDHEYYPEEFHDGDTSLYLEYFGESRYEGYDWYGGASPGGLSHYQMFDGGGVTFLHIALEWEAPPAALTWAENVIQDNPGVPTIITTHAYLRDGIKARTSETQACLNWSGDLGADGRPAEESRCGREGVDRDPDASSGEDMFDTLVAPYPQVFMVLNGHYHDNGRRTSNPDIEGCTITDPDYEFTPENYLKCNNGEYHQVSTNSAGSDVYEMLSNYQDYDNGGNGWLRIIKFRPGEGAGGLDRIEVQTYSPTLDTFQSGGASRFSFDLSFAERFGLDE